MVSFGPQHPYGHPVNGLPSSVAKLSREDLAKLHGTYFKPEGAALIVVGDVTLDEAKAMAQKSLGSWKGSAPVTQVPVAAGVATGKVFLVDRQDAAQTVVTQLLPGPQRQVDDYHALLLADATWGGGGFGNRLNLNLREKKGYSYSVRSTLSLMSKAGLWFAQGGIQTDKTQPALEEFVSELKGIAGTKPITEAEFTDAKARAMRGYSQKFESLGQIGSQIATLWAVGMPMSSLQTDLEGIQKVDLATVNAAAKKYATPSKASLLLVGDLSKIEAPIRKMNLGEVVVIDAEGRPASKPATN
jgi:zinc protease